MGDFSLLIVKSIENDCSKSAGKSSSTMNNWKIKSSAFLIKNKFVTKGSCVFFLINFFLERIKFQIYVFQLLATKLQTKIVKSTCCYELPIDCRRKQIESNSKLLQFWSWESWESSNSNLTIFLLSLPHSIDWSSSFFISPPLSVKAILKPENRLNFFDNLSFYW